MCYFLLFNKLIKWRQEKGCGRWRSRALTIHLAGGDDSNIDSDEEEEEDEEELTQNED